MNIERAVRILAGCMILVSLALYFFVGPKGLLLAGFVALNLIQSAFSGICPAEKVFGWLGLQGGACSVPEKR